jgi:uncharacterized protein
LIDDEKSSGLMLPVMALHFEEDDDPLLGPGLIPDDEREELLVQMVANTFNIYRYFAPVRMLRAVQPQPIHREHPKVGRNDPCYCGSGKKYKDCHGSGVTLH